MAKTIDMTPTWRGILPYLLVALEDGTEEGKKVAREELRRMAQAADNWNAHITVEESKVIRNDLYATGDENQY